MAPTLPVPRRRKTLFVPIDTLTRRGDVALHPRGVPRKGLRVRKSVKVRAVTLSNLIRVMPA